MIFKNQRKKEEVCSVKKKDKNRNRGTRSTDDCLIINSIAVLEQDSSITDHFWRKHVKKGSMWIATDKGLYFRYQNGEYYDTPQKIKYLDEPVRSVDIDYQGSAYAIADSGNYYYTASSSWNAIDWSFSNNKVNAIKILRADSTKAQWMKKGGIWMATDQGVYYRNFEQWGPPHKIANLDESIKSINVDHEGSANAIANSGGMSSKLYN